jgi:hypothetical protein
VLPGLVGEGRRFDAVFFDTYAEHYTHMMMIIISMSMNLRVMMIITNMMMLLHDGRDHDGVCDDDGV